MVITTKLGIDLQRPLYPYVINAVQGDQNTRELEISLYSGGVAFELPEGTTAAMRYGKPDNTKGIYDTMPDGSSAFSISGNTVSILLAPQMLTVPGTVSAQVVLMQGANVLSTFGIQVHVEGDPSAGVMVSEDYTNWRLWIEAELDAYLEKLKVNGEFVGGTVVGAVNMNNQRLYGLREPAAPTDAATKQFVEDTVKNAGGSGTVKSVAGVSPDASGNVALTASDVKALPIGGGDMEGPINMNGQKLSGLNAPTADDEAATKGYADELKNDTETYVNNAVRTAAPRNLLDNSDFRNPVNQRGAQYYEGETYCIDRWLLENDNSAIGINDGHIHFKCISDYAGLTQNLEHGDKLAGKTFTFAINTNGNVYTTTFKLRQAAGGRPLGDSGLTLYSVDGGDILLRSYGDNKIIAINWAALYEGEYTADNLPVYQPKGYGAELAECQRYYQVIDISGLPGMFISGTKFITKCPNTVPMRVFPTLIELLKDNIVTHDPSGNPYVLPVKQYILERGTNEYKIAIETEGGYSYFPGMIFSGNIALSADL